MTRQLKTFLARFRADDRGSIAVETVILIPALFWCYLALFAVFDSYRNYAINQKAAYTIGDLISRETTPLNPAYLTSSHNLLQYLTNTANASDVTLRISSIYYDGAQDAYQVEWSRAIGPRAAALSNGDIQEWQTRLPAMPDNEHVTVVETFVEYEPPFNTGLTDKTIQNFVFTKPRYAPCVQFDDGTLTSC